MCVKDRNGCGGLEVTQESLIRESCWGKIGHSQSGINGYFFFKWSQNWRKMLLLWRGLLGLRSPWYDL